MWFAIKQNKFVSRQDVRYDLTYIILTCLNTEQTQHTVNVSIQLKTTYLNSKMENMHAIVQGLHNWKIYKLSDLEFNI